MPRTPINYSNTTIYKIVCNDVNVLDTYVGHTTCMVKRKCQHKSSCNNEKSKEYNLNVYQSIRANGGWINWSMIEIEKYNCSDFQEAKKWERYWIETLKSTLNAVIPTRTGKEYRLEHKDELSKKNKEYRLEHADEIRARGVQYDTINKDKIRERKQKYYLKFKDEYAQYYLDNYERINKICPCVCGLSYRYKSKVRHERSKHHQDLIK